MRKIKFPFLNAVAEGGDAGGGGGDAAPAAADASAAPATADTVLAGGADTLPPLHERVPEKYRVMKPDGTFDTEATFAKVEEARSHLEKRLGSGDAPPKDASEYRVTVPEAFKDKVDAEKLAESDAFKGFRERMHKAGLSQAQFDAASAEFFDTAVQVAEELAGGGKTMSKEECIGELRKTWKSDAELQAGIKSGYRALVGTVGEESAKSLLGKFGNDPDFVLFAATIGKEMREDTPPSTGGQGGSAESIDELLVSEAYTNPKHPQHASVSERVRRHFERQASNAA